jgi:hypothetical protein
MVVSRRCAQWVVRTRKTTAVLSGRRRRCAVPRCRRCRGSLRLDRLTHRAHIIDTGTESWRLRHGLALRRRRPPDPRGPRRGRAPSYRRCTSPFGPGSGRQLATPPHPRQARSTTTTTDARWRHFKCPRCRSWARPPLAPWTRTGSRAGRSVRSAVPLGASTAHADGWSDSAAGASGTRRRRSLRRPIRSKPALTARRSVLSLVSSLADRRGSSDTCVPKRGSHVHSGRIRPELPTPAEQLSPSASQATSGAMRAAMLPA